ncbi:MAG: family 16 glycosylhydrolase [Saprospiraceae bacterium]
MKIKYIVIFNFVFFGVNAIRAQCPQLVWSDEFNSTDLNLSNWSYQIGDGCDINLCQWGNSELEWYTSTKENVLVSDGTLKLIAKQQTIQTRNYTSGRIRTNQKVDIKFGRIEARMKLPVGQGIWPAFWMLPTDNVYGGWPTSGELDIMEYLGHEPNKIHGTIHFGNPAPNNSSSTAEYTIQNTTFNSTFHDYALEWTEQEIKWFIDGYLYSSKSKSVVGNLKWPFDQKFHFVLNLAVGGGWPGNPNGSTVFPQTFEIDYVRVYDLVNQPYLEGKFQVLPGEKNIGFKLNNVPSNSLIEWTLPTGAKIASGQGTNSILVDWGNSTGKVNAKLKSSCGESNYNLEVSLVPILAKDIVLENFDMEARIKKTFSTGTLTEDAPNPSVNAINGSALCGKYVRSNSTQYDVLFYDVIDVKSGADFVSGEKKFYIDINCTAPVGTQILLQLEDKSSASSSNYPVGRHSRYTVTTTKQNEWERLAFNFLDRPSNAVSDFSINQLILLAAPNTLTGATYFLDNFEIYSKTTVPLKYVLNSNEVNIFPNPSKNELNVQTLGKEGIKQISIYDTSGRMIKSFNGKQSNSLIIKTDYLSPGLFNIRVELISGKEITKPFIKQ